MKKLTLGAAAAAGLTAIGALPAGAAEASGTNLARYRAVGKCVTIEQMRYCTDVGFLGKERGNWQALLSETLSKAAVGVGQQDAAPMLQRLEAMSAAELAVHQAQQIAEAKSAIDKVTTVEELGALSSGKIARSSLSAKAARVANATAASNIVYIMAGYNTEQVTSGYCGPATMQAIDWADDGSKETQDYWAPKVGYVAGSGTSTDGMKNAINTYTNWDTKSGGSYVVVNVNGFSTASFEAIFRRNVGTYYSPVLVNPILKTQYFDYIYFNHGGHFQTGRGYNFDNAAHLIGVFEPYDERDWVTGGAASAGLRYPTVSQEFGAVKANFGQVAY